MLQRIEKNLQNGFFWAEYFGYQVLDEGHSGFSLERRPEDEKKGVFMGRC